MDTYTEHACVCDYFPAAVCTFSICNNYVWELVFGGKKLLYRSFQTLCTGNDFELLPYFIQRDTHMCVYVKVRLQGRFLNLNTSRLPLMWSSPYVVALCAEEFVVTIKGLSAVSCAEWPVGTAWGCVTSVQPDKLWQHTCGFTISAHTTDAAYKKLILAKFVMCSDRILVMKMYNAYIYPHEHACTDIHIETNARRQTDMFSPSPQRIEKYLRW